MLSFKEYLTEERGRGLSIFDIDETLFHTKALVNVIKDGKVIRSLDNQEFNTYKLQPGEKFDFHQFRSAEVFRKTSPPIGKMVGKLKAILRNATASGSKVIIVTARANFDNKDVFLDTFRAHGIDIDSAYVERAGNLELGSAAKNKRFTFHKYLRSGQYDRIRLFDDSVQNLNSFMALAKDYPNVKFEAWFVTKDGSTKKFMPASRDKLS
jgi:hypothetical protein